MPGPLVFSRDYANQAQLADLAYVADSLRAGATPVQIQEAVRDGGRALANDAAALNAISNGYSVVASTGDPGSTFNSGLEAIILQNGSGARFLVIAGVEFPFSMTPTADLEQTISRTHLYGFNDLQYAELRTFMQTHLQPNGQPILFIGHSLGAQLARAAFADFSLQGRGSEISSVVTFAPYGFNQSARFFIPDGSLGTKPAVDNYLEILQQMSGNDDYRLLSFSVDGDWVPLALAGLSHPGNNQVLRPDGLPRGLYDHFLDAFPSLMTSNRNNENPVGYVRDVMGTISGPMADSAEAALGMGFGSFLLGGDQPLTLSVDLPALTALAQLRLGPLLPEGIVETSEGAFVDNRNRRVELVLNSSGQVIATRVRDGNSLMVEVEYDAAGNALSTRVTRNNNAVSFAFSSAGAEIGQVLGYYLADGNDIVGVIASSALRTFGENLGGSVGDVIGGSSIGSALTEASASFGPEFLANLESAGIGAISSYLSAELINALGVEGFAGELAQTGLNTYLSAIIVNLDKLALPVGAVGHKDLSDVVGGVNIGNVVGSFIGSKLAAEVISFDTIGGQLGSAIGSSLASLALANAISAVVAPAVGTSLAVTGIGSLFHTLGPLGAAGGPIGFAAAAFLGFIAGGLIGSIFGGTPRSGADVSWNDETQSFAVANAYSRKGGSKDAAIGMASAVAETFNSVLALTGGRLASGADVQAGNYGMRKKDYVYRPQSTREKDAITKRFDGKDGAEKLIGWGVYQGLTDADFQIVGGDLYVKRALYNTFALGGIDPNDFDPGIVLGNLATADRYKTYLANSTSINALIAAEPDSVFTAEWALVLARAVELGLTRRHESDWYGGFGLLMDEANATPANVEFGFDYDPFSDRTSRIIGLGDYVLGDAIDVAGQTVIDGTSGADTIQPATSAIDVAATIDAGEGDDVVHASDRGDNVFGGAGNDTLYGGRLDDWLLGGDGNDILHAGNQAGGPGGSGNYLDGGAGNDQLVGREGSDWLVGGAGVDTLTGGAGGDVLDAGKGNEGVSGASILGGAGSDQYIYRRGDGVDVYFDEGAGGSVGATSDSIGDATRARTAGTLAKNWAGGGDFTVDGSVKGGDDAIAFGDGITMNDVILERSGSVTTPGMDLIIKIQRPDDTWFDGDDKITVKDWFEGTRRIEWLRFANGEEIRIGDFVSIQKGTAGADVIIGTNGNDFQYGDDGNDTMFGLGGNDWQVGGKGNDLVSGNNDNDYELGGDDDDTVLGGSGNDVVSGDGGNDRVYGGAGNDVVVGGKGDDEMVGGAGSDIFRFSRGDGRDTIFDEYAGVWETAWLNGAYQTTASYAYAVAGDGTVTRTANGVTEVVADNDGWRGNFDYNEQGANKYLLRLAQPASGPLTKNSFSGSDTLEFGVGIDIQDLMFRRDGDDLRIAVTPSNSATSAFDAVADQIRVKDWYSTVSGVGKQIEYFQFVNTGSQLVNSIALVGGTDGSDVITATSASWITAGAGDDTITGSSSLDILVGGSGADTIDGGSNGNDILYGGDGDDILMGGTGAKILLGGAGSDTVSYANISGVTVFLDKTQGTGTSAPVDDVYESIENVTGGYGADKLYGDTGANILDGGTGGDDLYGGAGDDTYLMYADMGADTALDRVMSGLSGVAGDGGDDIVEVGAGSSLSNLTFVRNANDGLNISFSTSHRLVIKEFFATPDAVVETIQFADGLSASLATMLIASTAALTGTAAGELIIGRNNANNPDTLDGAAGNDILSGLLGNDTLRGGDGDDVLEGGLGGDVLDGGSDTITAGGMPSPDGNGDTIRYAGSSVSVSVNLATRVLSGGEADGDSIVADAGGVSTVENVTGSNAAGTGDLLVGDGRANMLAGLAGADTLDGGAGNDVLLGGEGVDVIQGGAGDDNIDAGDGDDVDVHGGDGGDTIAGDVGNDVLHGDAGADRLIGGAGNDTLWGGADGDTLTGGEGADTLHGEAGDDTLDGGIGHDLLVGGDGNDGLSGGAGDDSLQGGAGDDVYIFDAAAGSDTIVDAAGANRIAITGALSSQIWMTRAGDDLRVAIIGGTTNLTVSGFFAAASPTLIREIAANDASLFLKYAGGADYEGSLIRAMTDAGGLPANVAAIPQSVLDLQAAHWWVGGKAAPKVADQELTTEEDVALTGTLAVTDHDENVSAFAVATPAAHGTVTINAGTGAWSYTPNLNYSGADSFVLTVRDADGQSASSTVSVMVGSVNNAPAFGPTQPELATDENAADGTVIAAIAAVDVDGDPLTYTIADAMSPFAISASGVLTVRDGSVLDDGTPRSVNITISDDELSVTQAFTVTVRPVNDRPNAPVLSGMPISLVSESFGGVGPSIAGATIANFLLSDIDSTTLEVQLRAGDASVFQTVGDSLMFKGDYAPNFETLATAPGAMLVDRDGDGLKEVELVVSVEASDLYLASLGTVSLTIGIEDVNEAPTDIMLSQPAPTVVERDRPSEGAVLLAISLGTLTASDPDLAVAGEHVVFSVADARFELVNGNELRLKAGAALDFETAAIESGTGRRYVDVTVTAHDRGGGAGSRAFSEPVRVYVNDAIDYLYGTIAGDTGAGALIGQAGRDHIEGRQGSDEIFARAGNDDLYGGDGDDAMSGEGGDDAIWGEAGNDRLYGGADADRLYGGTGNDIVQGDAGDDRMWGEEGTDQLYGGDGADEVSAGAGDDYVDAGAGVFADIVWGGAGNDGILGGAGADQLFGEENDDILNGGAGADLLDGGAGVDTASYAGAASGVTAKLAAPAQNLGDAAGDSYVSIENLTGSSFADTLAGNAAANWIDGGDGGDWLQGESGEDSLYGGAGDDSLHGMDDADQLYGGAGADTLNGGAADDRLEGGAGDDVLIGGAGSDSIIFYRGDGNDTIDQTGAPLGDRDILGFSSDATRSAIANTNLWFEWSGDDIKVTVLGATTADGSVRLKDFGTADADQRANISYILAGQERTKDLAISHLADTLDRFVNERGVARPATQAGFNALYANTTVTLDGLTFKQHWDNFWTANAAPSLVFTNAAQLAAGWAEDERSTPASAFSLGVKLSDDIESNAVLEKWVKVVASDGSRVEDTSANRLLSNVSVAWPANGTDTGTISIEGRANASGTAYVWVHVKDAGGLEVNRWLPVTIAAVADAPNVTASSPGGNSVGNSIAINITAAVTDTDGSEVIDRVEIAGVPANFWFASGDGSVTTANNHVGGGVWRFSPAQLAGLRIVPTVGWSKDLVGASALRVTAFSKETSNGSVAASTIASLDVRINARPTDIVISAAVDENAPNGTIVGVATVVDPDRVEDGKIGTADWGHHAAMQSEGWILHTSSETQFVYMAGPDGTTVDVLRTGQFDGGAAGGEAGGGVGASAKIAIDPDKAYRFTVYVKPETIAQHPLYFGLNARFDGGTPWVENAADGSDNGNPYFIGSTAQAYGMQAGRWYRVEGYVLPRGHQLVPTGTFGGVFDAATGQKVGDTSAYRWNDVMPDTQIATRFFNYYGNAQSGWSTNWYQPTIEQLPAVTMDTTAGGRFAIDSRSGLITVANGSLIDYEERPAGDKYFRPNLTATDNGGLAYSEALAIAVRNVNEMPYWSGGDVEWSHFTETGLAAGSRPANANAVVSTIAVGDYDNTVPTLEFAPGGNPNDWFYIDQATKQIRIRSGLNFDFEWARGAGYSVYDWNGNGIQEALVANVVVRVTDGALTSADKTVRVFIEDVPENPNAPSLAVHNSIISEVIPGAPSTVGAVVARLNLSDPDGPTPELFFTSNPNNYFTIVGNEVRIANGVHFTSAWNRSAGMGYDLDGDTLRESYAGTISVAARDATGRVSDAISFGLMIEDVNERPNALSVSAQTYHPETLGSASHAGQSIATFDLTDPDGAVPSLVITGGNDHGWFTTSGDQLKFAGANFTAAWLRSSLGAHGMDGGFWYDRDGDGAHEIRVATLTLAARDRWGVQSDPFTYNVYIEDANEAPSITFASFSVAENMPGAGITPVGTVGWTDPDHSPRFRSPTFAITGGNDGPMFSINSTTGELRLQGSLNYEGTRYHYPQIRITDGGGLSSSSTGSVQATDVNDPPRPTHSSKWNHVGSHTYKILPNDEDHSSGFTASAVVHSSTFGATADVSWNAADNAFHLTLTSNPEYNNNDTGSVTVTVRDQGGNTGTKTFDFVVKGRTGINPPVVLDLDGDGVELVSVTSSNVYFDCDDDGDTDRTGWIGADDGFLALDRDGSGAIDSLGEFSFASDLAGAQSDLEGLRAYDSDGDGVFDRDDTLFQEFRVWRDANQDGVSQAGELKSLADWNITSISLGLERTGQTFEGATDNVLYATSEFTRPNGTTGDVGDVFLAYESNDDGGGAPASRLRGDQLSLEYLSAPVEGGSIRFAGLDAGVSLPDRLQATPAVERPGAATSPASGDPDGPAGLSPNELEALLAGLGQAGTGRRSIANGAGAPAMAKAPAASAPAVPAGPGASSPPTDVVGGQSVSPNGRSSAAPEPAPTDAAVSPAPRRVAASLEPVDDPLRRALAVLSRDGVGTLNSATRAPGALAGRAEAAFAPTADDAKLDRLIAAMASFQAGESAGASAPLGRAAAQDVAAQLAAPV